MACARRGRWAVDAGSSLLGGLPLGVLCLCVVACGDSTAKRIADAAANADADAAGQPTHDGGVHDASTGPDSGDGALPMDAGNGALPVDANVDANVDASPPELIDSIPASGAGNLDVTQTIELIFSEQVIVAPGAIRATDGRTSDGIELAFAPAKLAQTIVVTLVPPIDLPATVALDLGQGITDASGNPLAPTQLHFEAPVWLPVDAPLDAGSGGDATDVRIAVDGRDRAVVAWVEAQHAYAVRIEAGAAAALGAGPIDASQVQPSLGDEPSLALAIGADGAPVLALRESAGAAVYRYEASEWVSIGKDVDPVGGGQYAPTVAVDAGGAPVVAFDTAVGPGSTGLLVRRLDAGVWTSLDAPDAAVRGVRLATGGGTLSLAYHDADTGQLSVVRWPDTMASPDAWPGVFDGPARSFALSADGRDVVVTAQGRGTAQLAAGVFVPLARDIGYLRADGAADRALTHLSTGALSAFADRPAGEVSSRVFVQRVIDGRVEAIGPVLNRRRSADAWGPDIAADSADVTWIAWLERADDGVARVRVSHYNGPLGVAPHAVVDRSFDAGCLATVPPDGSPLEATGCFADSPARTPVAGFVPFDVRSPLWTDGAFKRRFLMLPPGGVVTYRDPGIWSLPAGSILMKEFAIDAVAGDPSSIRPVETRFLVVRDDANWDRYSYQWNQEGTVATLRSADPAQSIFAFDTLDAQGQPDSRVHFYPKRSFCLQCHETPGRALGLQTVQLNRNLDYGDTVDNQLRAMQRAGIFDDTAVEGLQRNARFMPSPLDPTYPLEPRLRAYLHANCSSCHHPLFGIDLRYESGTLDSGLCTKIARGDLEGSVIYWRDVLRQQSPGRAGPMPPLGTLVMDPQVEQLLTDWILDPQNICP